MSFSKVDRLHTTLECLELERVVSKVERSHARDTQSGSGLGSTDPNRHLGDLATGIVGCFRRIFRRHTRDRHEKGIYLGRSPSAKGLHAFLTAF